jgi:hypothetical protein
MSSKELPIFPAEVAARCSLFTGPIEPSEALPVVERLSQESSPLLEHPGLLRRHLLEKRKDS